MARKEVGRNVSLMDDVIEGRSTRSFEVNRAIILQYVRLTQKPTGLT